MQSLSKIIANQAIRTQTRRSIKSYIKHPLIGSILTSIASYYLIKGVNNVSKLK